ncbi:MAG TPA: HNH endonuclease signature motif containing protein [Xanthobacteraceae bacterium]|jgi:hypothetical protein|nr:HNH endonuclease signature motif containing protein [Xanthobacteraceae bacterium]
MLQRRTPLHRGGPIQRRTRLSAISERRKLAQYEYGKKRKKFLAARPKCERCGTANSRDVHHKNGRYGSAYLDENTWMALCRKCHDWVHQHPREAREQGLLK